MACCCWQILSTSALFCWKCLTLLFCCCHSVIQMSYSVILFFAILQMFVSVIIKNFILLYKIPLVIPLTNSFFIFKNGEIYDSLVNTICSEGLVNCQMYYRVYYNCVILFSFFKILTNNQKLKSHVYINQSKKYYEYNICHCNLISTYHMVVLQQNSI